MTKSRAVHEASIPPGAGCYTAPEAARLLKIPVLNIRRWLGGYSYLRDGERVARPPLWTPQAPRRGRQIDLGFRDLVELRFIDAFLKAGLSLATIRKCLEHARHEVDDDRPFSTRRFQTDGRTIFFEGISKADDSAVLDLKNRQFVFKQVIARTFRDLDFENDAVARWRPWRGKQSIVIDPLRSFGQPIAAKFGVPTVTLFEAAAAEGSVERVASLYEVPVSIVRDAINFETELRAA
jgi:uncharacterized protein (DUF433 family)/DNA-binding transcriptional MerR regulator